MSASLPGGSTAEGSGEGSGEAAVKVVAMTSTTLTAMVLARIVAMVLNHGFPLCLDLGHLLRFGEDWLACLARYLPRAHHLHYHGVITGKDHEAVVKEQADVSGFLGEALARSGFAGVVTLEMYELAKLEASLLELASVWSDFSQE